MEKLTIKPWQVMQAHENGAKVEVKLKHEKNYSGISIAEFNFVSCDYRIADLTADGMRLDELVDKFPEKIELLFDLSVKNELLTFGKSRCNTEVLIKFLLLYPECISQIKVKQEKKLRPWTMQEFEKHRDEWFKLKNIDEPVVYKITEYSKSVVTVSNYSVTYAKLSRDYTFTDGSPCGVLE